MSITYELREEAQGYGRYVYTPPQAEHLTDIADRIDAEHEETIQQVLMGEGGMPATDENMAEYGWMRLPKDADGVPVHVGDVMKGETVGGGFGEPFEIVGYIMSNGELEPMDEHKLPRKRKYLHHHHEPTVEDVLQKLLEQAVGYSDAHTTVALDAITDYAAKLRLAGDVE